MLGTGTLSLALPVRVLPLGSYHGLKTDPQNFGGPLHIPLRAVSPAKKDVLASQRIISKGVPQVSQPTR